MEHSSRTMTGGVSVRVRFAPSPTGHLHIGGLRTALFNWLFARHTNGSFLLRIEDTDLERSKDEYTQAIYQAFAWVGITSDEQPLIQSQRFEIYKAIGQQLLSQQRAYWCTCTPEQVEARVRQAGFTGDYHGGYDGHCRDKGYAHTSAAALRFTVTASESQPFVWDDAIRGTISFERDQIDDFIIIRSDGTPTYNFCVVIDDNASAITHVIRGEDHISNTPKQIALYQALGYTIPVFGHIPMILGPDGNKLSKRDGAVDVIAYQTMGYLPEALLNYIARLGWAHKDQEIFTVSELIEHFSLEAVGKKPSVFDYTKLAWLNGVYLRAADDAYLVERARALQSDVFERVIQAWSSEQVCAAIALYKERCATLCELIEAIVALYEGPTAYNQQDLTTHIDGTTRTLLDKVIAVIEAAEPDHFKQQLQDLCKQEGIKLGGIAQPIRIALTGCASSPGVFELIKVLGKDVVVQRLRGLQSVV